MCVEKSGKLQAAVEVAATSPAKKSSNSRLFVFDKNSKVHFLVDSGAEVSVIPPSNQRACKMSPNTDYKFCVSRVKGVKCKYVENEILTWLDTIRFSLQKGIGGYERIDFIWELFFWASGVICANSIMSIV